MGLTDKVKGMLGGGSGGDSEADEIAEEWVDDVDSEVSEEDGEMEMEQDVDTEPEAREWDSAYKFAEEYLEMRGFASMVDFTNKCMAYKINQSPMYRDKIANGVDTMNQITSMHEQLASIQGGNSDSKSMAEKANELEAANEVIDQAQKLSGQEDAMVRDMMALGEDLVSTFAENGLPRGGGREVDSSVNQRQEEM